MLEEKETIITSLSDQLPYHTYTVKLGENNCSIILSPQILLDIAAYAEANRATLTQEAQEDAKYHHTGQLEDTTETPQNKQEWRYRTSDLLL